MLYGRDVERAQIGALLDAAKASRSGALVVRGEAGIGKSALLEDARERAADMHVLSARGVESESELPFAGLHQLLRPVLHLIDRLPGRQAAALSGALGLAERAGEDRFLISTACLTLLSELAERRPVLCLVDDAQWLDTPSSDALLFVARRFDAEGIVMLFSARDGDDRGFEARELPCVELGGLDTEAAGEVIALRVDGDVAPAVRDLLVEQAGGNALALVELPAALTGGQLAGTEPLPERLPLTSDIERLFLGRMRRLAEPTQRLLLVVAADESGRLASVMRAAEALGIGPEALDGAERAGLVTVRGATVEVRHPLVRSAVYNGSPSSARRRAHLALADAFDGELESDQRAWHRAAAAEGPDEEIARDLEASAERAIHRGGYTAAATALERAAGLSAADRERTLRLLAAADAAWLAGKADRARALLSDAGRYAPPDLKVNVTDLLGRIEVRSGSFEDATTMLLTTARALASTDPATALRLMVDAEEATLYTGDIETAVQIGILAEQIAAANPDLDDRSAADVLIGIGLQMGGQFEEAAPLLREAMAAGATSEDLDEIVLATRVASGLGDDITALDFCTRALGIARERGAIGALPRILERVPFYEMRLGRYSSARVHAGEGLRLARELGQESGTHLSELAFVAAIQGREDECRSCAAEAIARAHERRSGLLASMATWALGLLELGLGRPEEAMEALASVLPSEGVLTHPIIALFLTPDYIEAAIRANRLDVAQATLGPFEAWARSVAQPWALALASHCHGFVSEAKDAEHHFEEALELHPQALRPFEHARTELALGEVLRRSRKRGKARDHLRAAISAFESLGAEPWAERARVELQATGETARKRDPSTIDQLTPQELQICRFVAEGLTNREIAAQLFLSPRTIDAHLRNVFSKLGITSRMQLVKLPLGADEPLTAVPA